MLVCTRIVCAIDRMMPSHPHLTILTHLPCLQERGDSYTTILLATNQAKLAIPFVVDSSNPSHSKGWSEEHITKTQAWYKALASWAHGHADMGATSTPQDATISLIEEWDMSNQGLALAIKAYKVGVCQGRLCVCMWHQSQFPTHMLLQTT